MLGPKGADAKGTEGKKDEETGTKTDNKSKRISCASCGQQTPSSKANRKTKPTDNEKPDEKSTADSDAEPDDIKAKPAEPLVDTEAIKSIVKQSKALYTALRPSSDPDDIGHYGEHDSNPTNGDIIMAPQTGYADVDMSHRQYDDFDMQAY